MISSSSDEDQEQMKNTLIQYYFKGFYLGEIKPKLELNKKKKLDDHKVFFQYIEKYINSQIAIELVFDLFKKMDISEADSKELLNEKEVDFGGQA